MNQVAAVAEPLVEDSGGKFLVQAKFKIHMGIEWAVWFAKQPAFPVRVLFAELGFASIKPPLPLHVGVLKHFRRNTRVYAYKTPAFFVHIPLLLDVYDLADFS